MLPSPLMLLHMPYVHVADVVVAATIIDVTVCPDTDAAVVVVVADVASVAYASAATFVASFAFDDAGDVVVAPAVGAATATIVSIYWC